VEACAAHRFGGAIDGYQLQHSNARRRKPTCDRSLETMSKRKQQQRKQKAARKGGAVDFDEMGSAQPTKKRKKNKKKQ